MKLIFDSTNQTDMKKTTNPNHYVKLVSTVIGRQNGTQAGIEALKKSLERSKK